MDAAVQGKKVEIYAAAQIKWTSAAIMDIEHSVLAVDIVEPKLIEDPSQSFELFSHHSRAKSLRESFCGMFLSWGR